MLRGTVFNGQNGNIITTVNIGSLDTGTPDKGSPFFGSIPILADFDNDGQIEFCDTKLWRWNMGKSAWEQVITTYSTAPSLYAYADFGKPKSDGTFDFDTLDGIAEIVAINQDTLQDVRIYSLAGTLLMKVGLPKSNITSGGPPNIGDFDGDGLPEIGVASKDTYSVFDPRCKEKSDTCEAANTLWTSKSQDVSSGATGSSTFDFDSDGRMEVVYADECYTRIYDGATGDVLFSSFRSSYTAYENPIIADVDGDMSAEIVIGSDKISNPVTCAVVDPIHHGIRCSEDGDCYSRTCVDGYCRCKDDSECNLKYDAKENSLNQYVCTEPLAPQKSVDGKVCRASHPKGMTRTGFRVLRDRLDRWASARSIWNQHAYSVTNVNDDGSIPKTSDWKMNFLDPKLNNYRQNSQGTLEANRAPDITGRFVGNVCAKTGDHVVLGAEICNRGTKMVASLMPASFYQIKTDGEGRETRTHLCTSYTPANVPVGDCLHVTCDIPEVIEGEIILVANDDGKGGKTTIECEENNNMDRTQIESCAEIIN